MTRDGFKLCLNGCFTVLPLSAFHKHPRSPDGYNSLCKQCDLDRSSVRKHGLTGRQKALLAEWQGGCRICRRPDPGGKGWVVDHDHACCPSEMSCEMCRRGILCHWCNAALGYAQDSPTILRRMADYLESDERIGPPNQFSDQWTEWVKRVARTDADDVLTQNPITQR